MYNYCKKKGFINEPQAWWDDCATEVSSALIGKYITSGGNLNNFNLSFMTIDDRFSINFDHMNEEANLLVSKLLFCFDKVEVEAETLHFTAEQRATSELKLRICNLIQPYLSQHPQMNKLKAKISNIPDNQFFLVLQEIPTDTETLLLYELWVETLNETEDPNELKSSFIKKSTQLNGFSGYLVSNYQVHIPRNDRRTIIGNATKDDRCCRFCGKSNQNGAFFKKVAHAIPEALGNKNIILGDECDECNQFFGDNIEPCLIEYFNIYRVMLNTKGKNGSPFIGYKNGSIHHDGNMVVLTSTIIENIKDSEFTINLNSSKEITPVNIYKALCKITLSTIDKSCIPLLSETINWIRSGAVEEKVLPKVAFTIEHSGFTKQPQIVNYVRKTKNHDIPHVVSEFRIGSFVYVYILPFSDNDTEDFTKEESFKNYWDTFNHYSGLKTWKFFSLTGTSKVSASSVIKLKINK